MLLKERDVNKHRSFNMRLFSRTDGNWKIRLVLSSYSFMPSGSQGIPDGLSDCSKYTGNQTIRCNGTPFRPAFVKDACGYSVFAGGQWIDGEYTRTHRDVSVINAMRAWMNLPPTNAQGLGLPGYCN